MRIVDIDKGLIKEMVFSSIMTKVSNQLGMETDNAIAPVIYRKLGLGFESIKETVFNNTNPNSVTEPIIRGAISTVDQLVDKFYNSKNGELLFNEGLEGDISNVEFQMAKFYAYEEEELKDQDDDETFDVEDGESSGETGIAIVVADLLKEVASATSTQATELAERVIALTKEDNNSKKEEELEGDEVSATEDGELEDGDKTNPFDDKEPEDEEKKEPKEESKEGEKKEPKEGEKKEPKEGEKKEPNPFAEGGDGDTDGNDDGKNEDDEKTSGTAFENASCKFITDLRIDLPNYANFMAGEEMRSNRIAPMLENHHISGYVTAMADELMGQDLQSKYVEFGMESVEFKTIKNEYMSTSTKILNATVSALVLTSKLDLNFNTSAILNPLLNL